MSKLAKGRVTIKDVATRAGVSIGTVSHVLNNTLAVSEQKTQLVRKAAAELGFRFDPIAQNLRRKSTRTVGFCTTFASPALLSAMTEALEKASEERGYDIIMAMSWQDPQRELRRIEAMVRNRVDGLFFMPSGSPKKSLDFLARSGMPTVLIERPTGDKRFDHVVIDQVELTDRITAHFARTGCRRILFIPQRAWIEISRLRAKSLRRAAKSCKMVCDVLERGEDFAAFRVALQDSMSGRKQPDAIVVGNSSVALWTLTALREIAPQWLRDNQLVTFDDPEWGGLIDPPLGKVGFPVTRIVEEAWRLMQDRFEGYAASGRETVVHGDFQPPGLAAIEQPPAQQRRASAT